MLFRSVRTFLKTLRSDMHRLGARQVQGLITSRDCAWCPTCYPRSAQALTAPALRFILDDSWLLRGLALGSSIGGMNGERSISRYERVWPQLTACRSATRLCRYTFKPRAASPSFHTGVNGTLHSCCTSGPSDFLSFPLHGRARLS